MIEISNTDFQTVLRLLGILSLARGNTVKEKENARKAGLLVKKLNKKVNGKLDQDRPKD